MTGWEGYDELNLCVVVGGRLRFEVHVYFERVQCPTGLTCVYYSIAY